MKHSSSFWGELRVHHVATPPVQLMTYETWDPHAPIEWFPISSGEPEGEPAPLFGQEKAAFLALLASLVTQYAGKYVAVHGGAVVDSDASRIVLVRRFLARFGDTHVYIGFVGERPPVAHQISPFRA